jgi:PKD repeat protein
VNLKNAAKLFSIAILFNKSFKFAIMKKTVLFLLLNVFTSYLFSQCSIEPFSLQKRVDMSSLIVEGKIINKKALWNKDQNFIYTINTVELYKSFKGTAPAKTIEIITEGGAIDLSMITASPSLELGMGETGVFLLTEDKMQLLGESEVKNRYIGVASVQSFIQYDLDEQKAYDYNQTFGAIATTLYGTLQEVTGLKMKEINKVVLDPWFGKIRPLATPVISSFSMDSVSAGTETLLTINGSNFGFARGSGGVGFIDANFGDGRYFEPEFNSSYKSWSNSKIEVYVPSRAGSGKVKVTTNGAESGTSSSNLYIKFSHLNSTYGSATIDTQYYVTDHIDDNTKGGYSWQMHTAFKNKTVAVNSFMRALENWRCGTLMNWDVAAETTVNAITRDGVNLVRLTKFTDSRLGVCYSYWSGCGSGSTLLWYVAELDIEFDSARNWYYGTGTPSGSQMDFESVATHELGHGHQMGHVNDSKKIMHYSIGNGQRKTTLTAEDLEGGRSVMDRSVQNNVCGPNKLVALSQTKCSITKPLAAFTSSKTVACPLEDITFTDKSEGIVDTYAWNFGSGASSTIANGAGPHTINYTAPGTKTVQLIVTNSFGKDTLEVEITINTAAPATPIALPYVDSVCLGQHTYTVNKVPGADTYLWLLSGGGSVVGTNTDTTVTVNWLTAGGPFEAKAIALNTCGNSANLALPVYTFANAVANFTNSVDGRNVTFTNTSTNATNYKWYFGDGDSSALQNPQHTYAFAGNWNVTLVANNFCSSSEKMNTATTQNGANVKEFGNHSIFSYPNPMENSWFVNNQYSGKKLTVVLSDVSGKIIETYEFKHKDVHEINVANLQPGIYIASFILNEQFIGAQRLLKK